MGKSRKLCSQAKDLNAEVEVDDIEVSEDLGIQVGAPVIQL